MCRKTDGVVASEISDERKTTNSSKSPGTLENNESVSQSISERAESSTTLADRIRPTTIIELNEDQSRNTTFPIGCNVWYNLQLDANGSASFQQGKVVAVQVNLTNGNGFFTYTFSVAPLKAEDEFSEIFGESELVFAPGSPILHSPSGLFHDAELASGVILCCRKTKDSHCCLYTIMTCSNGENETSQMIEGVSAASIKYNPRNPSTF